MRKDTSEESVAKVKYISRKEGIDFDMHWAVVTLSKGKDQTQLNPQ